MSEQISAKIHSTTVEGEKVLQEFLNEVQRLFRQLSNSICCIFYCTWQKILFVGIKAYTID